MSHNEHILLVEDDRGLRELLQEELEAENYRVTACGDAERALQILATDTPSLLISDLRLPGADGLSLLPALQQCEAPPAVLIITAFGSVQQAVKALQSGADDFLTKPLEMDHFLLTVRRLLEHRRLRREVQHYRNLLAVEQFNGIVGQSPAMQQLFHQIRQIARADGPVLVQGESGTGKELVARALHDQSSRSDGPYLVVNCGGIPGELMESEFFGHAAGAFTGARTQRAGLFQQADGGTLMLDELGEMPLPLQAKLLRVLQDGRLRPVGTDHELQVDVRIIAATNRNLTEAVADGSFREDLFYRLETFAIQVPPLRARGDDVLRLAQFFLARLNARQQTRIKGFSDEALGVLQAYPFPGNVRELQNAVERAATFCDSSLIEPRHLPQRICEQLTDPDMPISPVLEGPTTLPRTGDPEGMPSLETVQRHYIHQVLHATGGNKRRAAEILGITRRTLYRWLE
ncbi:DNA-binding transcriptional response regulator, NtrC family, contains REC, AAA-type ATPase, and a Fis-type DNA-binding domains [Halopseudomonas formosensis]|uniref:DNA-binding transcriptional response regulator, NtrC family, contains REC, AAA-type ATPase, and a Fis-type DNA-binding domains n=1 Tax=Halopseudomonas formosensis TaxID=1002526 RepID=A0A1I6AV01_9GAMM|nr:sigma-54 dependent transcriptional regulator [Halopseudomonas formosensis]SFQ72453.1 DNA-binding transcriptional response regulator, NtrC family, contains REC, AAA-type ATPase, and a Fis-type DNA-binding domains [Halopseudomonas formosensis]